MIATIIAARMLECAENELDPDLVAKLKSVQELIVKAGWHGDLHSTQVIATIIEQFYREKGR